MTDTIEGERDALLLKFLGQVPFEGWTLRALAAGEPDEAKTIRLFPAGLIGILDHFADWADRQMETRIAGVELDAFRIPDRIALLIRERLIALRPYEEAVRREAFFLAFSGRPDLAPRLVWRTASRMWYLAGDKATDFNHYSKRALLSGVLASTTLCWLADKSPDKADTWAFLERRLGDVAQFGKTLGMVKKYADPSAAMESLIGFLGRLRHGM